MESWLVWLGVVGTAFGIILCFVFYHLCEYALTPAYDPSKDKKEGPTIQHSTFGGHEKADVPQILDDDDDAIYEEIETMDIISLA